MGALSDLQRDRAAGDLTGPLAGPEAECEGREADAALVEERLRAYMRPNEAVTEEEQGALARAVDAQLAYERAGGLDELPAGAASVSIGNYSVTLREAADAALTQHNICPVAWAILYNAGLLRRRWPVAKRL